MHWYVVNNSFSRECGLKKVASCETSGTEVSIKVAH
jgi:hypothetical protein